MLLLKNVRFPDSSCVNFSKVGAYGEKPFPGMIFPIRYPQLLLHLPLGSLTALYLYTLYVPLSFLIRQQLHGLYFVISSGIDDLRAIIYLSDAYVYFLFSYVHFIILRYIISSVFTWAFAIILVVLGW